MGEQQRPREVEPNIPIADAVRQVFERRAAHGERRLILETYRKRFDDLLKTLPKENRDTMSIKIQRLFVTIGGGFAEYASRFVDFARNVFVAPMVWATQDFPKDKYYQLNLAGAEAWGEFAMRTTATATKERSAYRDHFFSSAMAGVPFGGVAGAVALGALEGTKLGLLGGVVGAAAGAAIGAATGAALSGGRSLLLKLQDAVIGPPVAYYGLYSFHSPFMVVAQSPVGLPSVSPFLGPGKILSA